MAYRWTEDDVTQMRANRGRGGVDRTRNASAAIIHGKVRGRKLGEQPPTAQLVSSPAPSPKLAYKSKLESTWAVRLEAMKRMGEIDGWLYEPFSFRLAEGKRYRVDFVTFKDTTLTFEDGSSMHYQMTTCYETKGWHKNYRDALTHLKWAAQRFPFFQWKKVVRNGKTGFEIYDVVV